MKFENTKIYNLDGAFRGMRNPKESWDKSDSISCFFQLNGNNMSKIDSVAEAWTRDRFGNNYWNENDEILADADDYSLTRLNWLMNNGVTAFDEESEYGYGTFIGPKDMKLAQRLINAGSEHRKFMRQIMVSVDITAPIYWWKEFDTYKVGTVANSTSTMHTIMNHPITLDCFEIDDFNSVTFPEYAQRDDLKYPIDPDFIQMCLIPYLEYLRSLYLETEDKKIWKELIRWLPESWLQTRTVTMSYENLLAMCGRGQRRFHKLNEWSGQDDSTKDNFISWARCLPYAQELLFVDEVTESKN